MDFIRVVNTHLGVLGQDQVAQLTQLDRHRSEIETLQRCNDVWMEEIEWLTAEKVQLQRECRFLTGSYAQCSQMYRYAVEHSQDPAAMMLQAHAAYLEEQQAQQEQQQSQQELQV